MKKLLLLSAIVFIIALCGCQQSSEPPLVIVPPVVTTPTNPDNPTNPGNTPTGGGDVIPNASNLVFIGQGNETLDSVEYLVKKYADVFLDDPYFYTYYKVYYLNDKVRRIYSCQHGIGSQRDYKYSEFNETECRKDHNVEDFYYSENGKREKYIAINYDKAGNMFSQTTRTYYPSGNLKSSETLTNAPQLPGAYPQIIVTCYDQTVNENYLGYAPVGYITGVKLYTAFQNQTLNYFLYFYESGYLKYYYSNDYYYEYADNTTRTASTDSSVYTTRTAYTNDQALAKFNELKNN